MKTLSIVNAPKEIVGRINIDDEGILIELDKPIENLSIGKVIYIGTKESKVFATVNHVIFGDDSTWIYIHNQVNERIFSGEPISLKYTSQNEVKFADVSTIYTPIKKSQQNETIVLPVVVKENLKKTNIDFMKSVPEEVIKQFNPEKGYAIVELTSIVDSIKDVKMIMIRTDGSPIPATIKSTFNFENKTWIYALISMHKVETFKDEPSSIKYLVESSSHFVPLSKVYL